MLTTEQVNELPQKILDQLRILAFATEEGRFSGEQIAEMKIWLDSIVKSLEYFALNQECLDLIKKLSNS